MISYSAFSKLNASLLVPLHSHSPFHSHTDPFHSHASLTHPLTLTLTLAPLSLSHLSALMSLSTLKHPFHSHLVLSSMVFLLCDFFMWVCGFCSKIMIDLIVSCVTLFGSQENARKIFYFVLRLSCLRKFNMRKLRDLRNEETLH